jgi:hypothetical protein
LCRINKILPFYEILNLKPIYSKISNARNLIGWTWRQTLKHWNPVHDLQWWKRDGTEVRWWNAILRWWKHDGMNVKLLLCDSENNDGTMVKTRCYDGENTMVRWWNCDGMMMKTRHYFHHRVIASWWFCHRSIAVSSSWRRVFIIVPSYKLIAL